MTASHKVALFPGSLRRHGMTRRLGRILAELAPPTLAIETVEIGGLPLYDADLEAAAPSAWLDLRRQLQGADAVLFVTPEHNRSIPAALKNAIDVGSRPYGENSWAGKPGAIVSFSTGAMGGFGVNHHLRQCLVFVDVPTMQQPEVYLGNADAVIDERGRMVSESAEDFLRQFMTAFADWISLTRR
ncbi:MAG: NAD(P)H-dependent oxidoreductase [Rhizobiaceae bacterium]|nr:NAD(P)H-dependent oxidoreductase [Rhizobiaceae bacterium]